MSDKIILVTDQIIEKWLPVIEAKGEWADKIGNAPKVKSEHYGFMAHQLESLEQNVLTETNVAGDIATYNPVLIPIIRRVWPAMIGPDIFGTQPMKTATGQIFYLRSLYQGQGANEIDFGLTNSAVILYNATLNTTVTVGTSTVSNNSSVGLITYKETQSDVGFAIVKMTSGTTISAGVTATFGGSGGLVIGITISAVYTNEENFNYILQGYSGPYSTSITSCGAVSTSSLYETWSTQNELGVAWELQNVSAQKRTLKVRWSREFEEDLKSSHAMNAEGLLTEVATEEISREMNKEFVQLIDAQCTSANSNSLTLSYGGLDGTWELQKYQNLVAYLNRVKFDIANKSRRGPATFIICNIKGLAVLGSTGRLDTTGFDPVQSAYAGTFEGMKVYVDMYSPYMTTPVLYLGYKGTKEVDAGLFYCPYIPMRVDKGVGADDNNPRMFFSTRYATAANQFGASNYFTKVVLTGFPA